MDSRKLFLKFLLVCTSLPFIMFPIANNINKMELNQIIDFLILISSAHVFMTYYLFFDNDFINLSKQNIKNIYHIPILLLVLTIISMSNINVLFSYVVLIFFLYQTWHFGAQNIGVSSFFSKINEKKPLSNMEKNYIKLGTITGMMGVLFALTPNFMIGENVVILSINEQDLIKNIFYIGKYFLNPLVLGLGIFMFISNLKKRQISSNLIIFISIIFYSPIFLFKNPNVGILIAALAHGLQYLIFIFYYKYGQNNFMVRTIKLVIFFLIAVMLWRNSSIFNSNTYPYMGVAILFGLTFAHFWIDQNIWRMKNKNTREWIGNGYKNIFS